MDIEVIISAVLMVATAIFGGYLAKFKAIISDVRELIAEVSDALADNTITADEWADILAAFHALLANFNSSKQRKKALAFAKQANDKRIKRKAKG